MLLTDILNDFHPLFEDDKRNIAKQKKVNNVKNKEKPKVETPKTPFTVIRTARFEKDLANRLGDYDSKTQKEITDDIKTVYPYLVNGTGGTLINVYGKKYQYHMWDVPINTGDFHVAGNNVIIFRYDYENHRVFLDQFGTHLQLGIWK
jgi:hypothetical protein